MFGGRLPLFASTLAAVACSFPDVKFNNMVDSAGPADATSGDEATRSMDVGVHEGGMTMDVIADRNGGGPSTDHAVVDDP